MVLCERTRVQKIGRVGEEKKRGTRCVTPLLFTSILFYSRTIGYRTQYRTYMYEWLLHTYVRMQLLIAFFSLASRSLFPSYVLYVELSSPNPETLLLFAAVLKTSLPPPWFTLSFPCPFFPLLSTHWDVHHNPTERKRHWQPSHPRSSYSVLPFMACVLISHIS